MVPRELEDLMRVLFESRYSSAAGPFVKTAIYGSPDITFDQVLEGIRENVFMETCLYDELRTAEALLEVFDIAPKLRRH